MVRYLTSMYGYAHMVIIHIIVMAIREFGRLY